MLVFCGKRSYGKSFFACGVVVFGESERNIFSRRHVFYYIIAVCVRNYRPKRTVLRFYGNARNCGARSRVGYFAFNGNEMLYKGNVLGKSKVRIKVAGLYDSGMALIPYFTVLYNH